LRTAPVRDQRAPESGALAGALAGLLGDAGAEAAAAAGAGAEAGAAGLFARLSGVSTCGSVARSRAAGSWGRYKGPRWPQPTKTMKAAPKQGPTRILRTLSMDAL